MIAVTEQVLDVAAHLDAVVDPSCGAVVTFVGQIRDHDPGVEGEVAGIEYSAHPDAEQVLVGIVGDVLAPVIAAGEPVRIAVSHRVGPLVVGDVALVACVATAHRALAYDVSRDLVERIKVELPVWKKQHIATGESHWVGL